MNEQSDPLYPDAMDEEGRGRLDQLRRLLRDGQCRPEEAGRIETIFISFEGMRMGLEQPSDQQVSRDLSEQQRLEIICDTIRFCRSMRDKKAGSDLYGRTLRYAIVNLWELWGRNKDYAARWRSKASGSMSMSQAKGALVYEHAIPMASVQEALLALSMLTTEAVRAVLEEKVFTCIVTVDEDRRLREARLGRKMPDGWDGIDIRARYAATGIEIVDNPLWAHGPEKTTN